MGKYSLGGQGADPGPVVRTAGPPAWPRTHRVCSLLWTPGTTEMPPGHRAPQPHPLPGCPQPGMEGSLPRQCDHKAGRWGLTVSQERCQAAAQWSRVLPRGPGLSPRKVGRVPGDGPRAWAGRPGTGVSAAVSAEPAGAGPLGGQRPLCWVRCQGSGRLRPQRMPTAVPGLRWPCASALRSRSGDQCLGECRLSWVRPPCLPPPRWQSAPGAPLPEGHVPGGVHRPPKGSEQPARWPREPPHEA